MTNLELLSINSFQELSARLDDHAPEVEKVGHKGDNLLGKVHDSSPDRAVITDKVADVSQKYVVLQQRLKAQEESLANKIKDTDEFNAKIDDLGACVKNVRNELASLGPISTDPSAVEKQLQLVQVGFAYTYSRFYEAAHGLFVLLSQ